MTKKSYAIVALYLLTLSCLASSCYSSDPLNQKYGTHDWIAEHALDWLTPNIKQWIISNMNWYLYGTELPDSDRCYRCWSDDSTSNPRTVSVSSDATLTAYMKIQYLLTVSINPIGTGNVSLSLLVSTFEWHRCFLPFH
jgi:hypothetical protein